VAASITNQNGTISFGDVDADTNTVTDTTLMTGETSTIVDLSGSNATLAANQTPPATPFADIGTFLELRANGDSPVLSTNVSYSSSEVTDLNESSLRLHTYDGNWTPINGSTVDTDAQVVSGTITETGTFAPLDPSTPVSQDEAEDSGNESDDDSNSSGDNADDSSSKDDSSGSGGGAIGGTPLPPRNPDGDDDSGSDDSESADEGSNEPTAEISLDSGTATAGESLTVSAEASSVEGSKIVAYNWTIDDEQYGGETVTTTVEESGELRIELTVTAANDEEDSTTTTLPVETATPAGNETADDSTDETAGNDSTDSSTPGFGAIAALLGILFGLGLRRRR
jgi:PGF-CTERM protein